MPWGHGDAPWASMNYGPGTSTVNRRSPGTWQRNKNPHCLHAWQLCVNFVMHAPFQGRRLLLSIPYDVTLLRLSQVEPLKLRQYLFVSQDCNVHVVSRLQDAVDESMDQRLVGAKTMALRPISAEARNST